MPAFALIVRIFCTTALLLCSYIITLTTASAASEAHGTTLSAPNKASTVLTLYNWSEYVDDKIIKSFETLHNIKIHQVFYETDALKDEYLISTNGGEGLDIIIGSEVSFKTYIKQGWLASLDLEKVPNAKHVSPRWSAVSPSLSAHSLPYLWGTVGIAYRKDKVQEAVSSWLDLFRPRPELKGKIIMIDDSRDTLGLALKALGYSTNSTKINELISAEKLLRNQHPYVSKYSYINLSKESSLVKGDTWMTMVYNGDGITLQNIHPDISFVVPDEGTNLWIDHIAVLQQSKNKHLAFQFINYINQPKNAAQIATTLNFASPNAGAQEFLDKSFLEDTAIYPSIGILNKSESLAEFSPKEQKTRNEVYMRVIE